MAFSLAFLLQDQLDAGLSAQVLCKQLAMDWPDLASATPAASYGEGDDGPMSIDCGDYTIMVMPVAAPIGDDLVQITAHSRLWPKDKPAPADYRAHLIVTVLDSQGSGEEVAEGDYERAIARMTMLTQVLASLIAASDSVVAVYWGEANHAVLPPLLRDLALEVLPDEPMPMVWVALSVGERPDGVMTGHTRGMRALGLWDIEIPESNETAQQVYDRLEGISDYLIDNGLVIQDGDTLGNTAEEQIKVVYAPSSLDEKHEVLRLVMPRQTSKKSWWKKLLH